jgi:hypothetical protein
VSEVRISTEVRLYAGDTWRRSWRLKQPSGLPVDLTGANARLHLRDSAGLLLIEASTGADGRIVITPAEGLIAMTVAAADTSTFAVGRYRWALEITDAAGIVTTLESGILVVMEDVTHD